MSYVILGVEKQVDTDSNTKSAFAASENFNLLMNLLDY